MARRRAVSAASCPPRAVAVASDEGLTPFQPDKVFPNDGAGSESTGASTISHTEAHTTPSLVGHVTLPSELLSRFKVVALTCLLATAALGLVVAHGHSPYAFEKPALAWLGGPPSAANRTWADLARFLAAPLIGAVLVIALVIALRRRAPLRVAAYAVLAASAVLISENIAKPFVQRTYEAELTFPSGHVTAASASALALWLALYPLVGKRARNIVLALGIVWTVLMSLAVVGAHWHTPVDAVGSILLSVGIVSAGAVAVEPFGTRRPFMKVERARGRDT
jgi:membrane-associated phospholipid phosphatase